jgi:hypothetical protein
VIQAVIRKKTETLFNCVLVFHFQKAQRRFRRIVARYGCWECVAKDMYHTAPAGYDFVRSSYGAEMSYATGTNSAGATHDDDDPHLGLDLDTMADVLSQLEDAPDPTQPS